jgi:hypothetical protein
MRKVKVERWKAKLPDGTEMEETLLTALNALIIAKRPEDMPRGLDNFRLMNRLAKAFDKAEETGILELEENEYSLLKNSIEKDIPSIWGSNKNITQAIDLFLEAKQE